MRIKDAELWRQWQERNPVGDADLVREFTSRWMELIEAELADGKKLEDVAQETREKAGKDITFGTYFGAVLTLVGTQEYGEELRRWHNKKWTLDKGTLERVNREGKLILPAIF